jgi:hypothetical protein
MPRIPRDPPAWLNNFVEYSRDRERKTEGKKALDKFKEVLEKRWEPYHDEVTANQPPPKKRRTDPVKTLHNAMKKVAEHAGNMDDQSVLRGRILDGVPPEIQSILQPPVQKNQEIMVKIESLREETEKSKTSLEQGDSKAALDLVTKVSSGLQEIKDLLDHVPSGAASCNSGAGGDEATDDESAVEPIEDTDE